MAKDKYETLATKIRIDALKMVHHARSSHIGGCLSIADLLAVLYGGVLNVEPCNPSLPNRDRFILSKGHASAILYAVLAERGFIPLEQLDTFYQNGSHLLGHVTHTIKGVEVSAGSLGHGLPIGCGMALAGKGFYRVFVLLSDGECDEGSTWEAVLFASHHKLNNLVAIVDYNKIQSFGRVGDVLSLYPLGRKWSSFGWAVREIDGHNRSEIDTTLESVPFVSTKPSCVIAHTVKGKGISFLENTLLSHYISLSEIQYNQAMSELCRKE